MIETQNIEGVAVVKLGRGVINAINIEMVNKLGEAMKAVREDAGISALVLASASDKFFSMGFDVPELIKLDRPGMEEFVIAYDDLCLDIYAFPKPVVASVNAHAIAGGCILALCCDYRFIADGRCLMGLNEAKLGVPLPYLASRVLEKTAGSSNAREMAYTGDLYQPGELLRMQVVDGIFPPERVFEESVEKARLLGSMPREAFAAIKRDRAEETTSLFEANCHKKHRVFLDCWFSGPTRLLLAEAAEKFAPKS